MGIRFVLLGFVIVVGLVGCREGEVNNTGQDGSSIADGQDGGQETGDELVQPDRG